VALDVPTTDPIEISWFATPLPGGTIEGYRTFTDWGDGTLQPTSLSNTSMVVTPSTDVFQPTFFYVEVQFDQGKRAMYGVGVRYRPGTQARAN
jgi:hypothetical protein